MLETTSGQYGEEGLRRRRRGSKIDGIDEKDLE
jgi:hypothetical protein